MTKQLEDYPELNEWWEWNVSTDTTGSFFIETLSADIVEEKLLELAQQLEQANGRVDEFESMLKHLVGHECISDCSLHKECETLLNKDSN